MKLWTTLLMATVAFSTTIPTQAETVYKWKDDEGVIQYTDSAPTNHEYSTFEVRGGVPSGAEKATQKLEQQRSGKYQSEQKAGEYAQQKNERDKQAKVRKENCANAQKNLKMMQENSRIRILDDDGEFRYINDEERQQHIDKATDTITENCNS